jgi:HAE1 family hydrophobic/amphiphilic exporter-1
VVVALSFGGAWMLMPPASYLPNGNRNFMIARMATPPGYSLKQNTLLGQRIEREIEPYWKARNSAEATAIQPLRDRAGKRVTNVSAIEDIIMIISSGQVFMICTSKDPEHPKDLLPALNNMMLKVPTCTGFASQPSIFGRSAGGSNSVDVEMVGNSMETLRAGAAELQEKLYATFGRFSVRADPQSFELSGPERQLVIDQVRAKELGLSVADLARGVRALIDGDIIGEFNYEGDTIDLVVIRDPNIPMTPEGISNAPMAVASIGGKVTHVPLRELVSLLPADASRSIKRVEGQRAITFNVNPPEEMALEQAEEVIRGVVADLRKQGSVSPDVNVNFSGNADRLSQTRAALLGKWSGWNLDSVLSVGFSRFFLALVITYLLMAALFESFLYPFVIMFSVPMAMVGGFMGLAIVRAYDPAQQLDTLTMLGFIILIGIVVNNAILLVHQALNFMRGRGEAEEDIREPLGPREAIAESVKTRMRPIFMTTATSVIGMMPLIVAPGSGSELYRGLGAVVVGGLSVSTVFTLLVVPLLFSLVIDVKTGILRLLGREFTETSAAEQL